MVRLNKVDTATITIATIVATTTILNRNRSAMKFAKFVLVATIAALFTACLAPQNATMVGVDARSWSKRASIIVENNDTVTLRNLNIAIRYNEKMKEVALPLKVTVLTPDSCRFEEVIELPLHHPTTALAVATTESLPYRSQTLLNRRGNYIFSFEPLREISGLEAIGIEFKGIE
jgi:hypothetical protein